MSKSNSDGDDVVLLVDDILSNGQAILSLLELVSKRAAKVAGVGVAIEKGHAGRRSCSAAGWHPGGGPRTVEHIEGDRIILKD